MLKSRHRKDLKMAHRWILYGLCMTIMAEMGQAEPIPRGHQASRKALENSKDPSGSNIKDAPTTLAPPSGMGLLVAPQNLQGSGGDSREKSGDGSKEGSSSASGVGSRESQTGPSWAGSPESPLSPSGVGSREHVSSKSREDSNGLSSGSSRAGSRESSGSLSGAGSREALSSHSSESSSGISGGGSREHSSSQSKETSGDSQSGPSGTRSGESSSGLGSRERNAMPSGAGSRESREDQTTTVPHNQPVLPPVETGTDSSVHHDLTSGVGGVLSQEVSSGQPEPEMRRQEYSQEEFDSLTDFPETAHVRRSREVQEVTSHPSSGAAHIPTPPMQRAPEAGTLDVEAVVRTLQTQVLESQTSQARTRSILNVLQERQAAQEQDLASLKAELSGLRARQEEDHWALEEVRGMVSDTSWAVKDLKASQDQLHVDFLAFKRFQQVQNDTMIELEDDLGEAQDHQYSYGDMLTRLHIDMQRLKTSLSRDRDVMSRLKQLLGSLDWARKQMASRHDHVNSIPLVPTGSGESSGGDNFRSDTVASSFEEADNSIGHNIVELYKHKHHMHMQIENVNKRFLQYDAEMSRVYAMYYNLSLQISSLENKVLTRQQQRFDTDMAALQHSFMNFTQQVFNVEQMHMTTKSQLNATTQNERRIHRLSSSVDNHQMRIRTLENLLVDYRSTNQDFRRMLDAHLGTMNESVVTVRGRLKDHKSRATLNFGEVQERLSDLRNEVKRHHRRLLQVEVKTLNESLSQCKKVNDDNVQDMKIDQIRHDLRRLDGQVGDHTGQLTRHDRSLGSIYKEVQGNNRMIGEVMSQSKLLFDLVPRTTTLEEEVNKMMMHLPHDCAVPLHENNNKAGLYLIKPDRSIRSVRVACEGGHSGPWLVIQRRQSGDESFARTWDEYAAGFGDPEAEFWIGNDNLNALTTQDQYRLHIDMWDLDDVYYFVEYDFFRVEDAETNYRLLLDGYHGNATDALRYSNYMPFSTMDRDHDVSSTHCAKFYTSGWWYKHCHYSNLNGRYTVGVVWFNHDFDEWIQMKRTVMKIQAVNSTTGPPS